MFARVRLITLSIMVAFAVLGAGSPAGAATDRLPDLRMRKLTGLRISTTSSGRRLLRFSTIIVNTGAGRFALRGSRPNTSTKLMTVRQRIYNSDGNYYTIPTDAVMYFAGDGHTHWHVRDLEEYSLSRLDNGQRVATGAKHGFCFFDNYRHNLSLPYSPDSPVYRACGKSYYTRVTMGLSVGWGDKYSYSLPDQYIEVTKLPNGVYRLRATADPANWFRESSQVNNYTWMDIRITGTNVEVLRYGPYAP